MATAFGKQIVHQHSQVWFFLFLTICFTLCGAGACQPLDMNGGSGKKNWTALVDAGNTAAKAGDYATAEASYISAEKACAKEFGKDDGRRATCLGYLAQMYREQQEYRKAALIYKELIGIHEKIDPKSSDLVTIKAQYAEIQKKIKDYGLDADPHAPKHAAKPGDKDKKPAKKH